MRFLFHYAKAYPWKVVMAFVGSILFVTVRLGLPTLLALIINQALAGQSKQQLFIYVALMFVVTVLGFLGQILSRYVVSSLANNVVRDIRNDVYSKVLELSFHEFQDFGVPSLSTRLTSDAFLLLQFTVLIFGMGVTAPLMLAVSIGLILNVSTKLGAALSPLFLLVLVVIAIIVRVTLPISRAQQDMLDAINRTQRENITGLRVIRAFNREAFQEQRFHKANDAYRSLSERLFKILGTANPAFNLIIHTALALVVWLGAGEVAVSNIPVGSVVACIEYVFEALFGLTLFSAIFLTYPRVQAATTRMQEILDTPISVEEKPDAQTETDGRGELEFRDVSFSYPDADEPTLRHISFTSHAGETVAFIGSTGSGKSTVVKLIPRFYDPTRGQILLDGVDIRDLSLKTLRDKIGYTPQKANLFTGQISDNLRYGKQNAELRDFERATAIAQADEFINRIPNGFETTLTEGGSNLSGGQKQRLSIARSVIEDHEIYIFDDSFSALDYKTDAAVRQKLAEQTEHATTIIVAQRVATIMNADQIIVLDHGEIAAKGTHKELLETSDIYREIAESQLSEEELANA